jgi:hypothetical protein
MKNAPVKLFGKKIVANPQDVSTGASIDGIAKSFEESPTFTDSTKRADVVDSYQFAMRGFSTFHPSLLYVSQPKWIYFQNCLIS